MQKQINDAIRAELSKLQAFTAETMARATYRALCALSAREGQNPKSEVMIKKPGEPRHFSDATCWCVAWEAGPYEWAISASFAIGQATGKVVEPYYSFDLCFYPAEDR